MDLNKLAKRYGGLTEEYKFYNGEVTIRYDVKNHKYLLVTPSGLEEQDGVTTICHIIDKSPALMNWAVKMMAQKLLDTVSTYNVETVDHRTQSYVAEMRYEDFEKLVLEAKKAKDEKLEDAGAVGNLAHNWIEQYIKLAIPLHSGECCTDKGPMEAHLAKMPEDQRAKNACIAMLDWSREHNVRFLCTERKIYSRRWKYAGTMDGLAYVDSCSNPKCCPRAFKDRLSVVDWKTSNYLYIEYLFQTAAYKSAYEEETGLVIPDRWVIRLGKDDAKFDPWHLEEETTDLDMRGFLMCLSLSRLVAEVEARVQAKDDLARAERKAVRKAAREAKETLKAEEKARGKAERQQARIEALRLACPASKKYKGLRRPACKTNDGGPCVTCMAKYTEQSSIYKGKVSFIINGLNPLDILKK